MSLTILLNSVCANTAWSIPKTDTVPVYPVKTTVLRFAVQEMIRYDSVLNENRYLQEKVDSLYKIKTYFERQIEGYKLNEGRYEDLYKNEQAKVASKDIQVQALRRSLRTTVRVGRVKTVGLIVSVAVAGYFAYRALK